MNLNKPLNYLAMVVDRRKLLDTVEKEAAERFLMRNPQKKSKTDHTTDEDNRNKKKKKKRRQFADELRAASSAWPRPPRSMSTRSMASGSASSSTGTKRKAEETTVREFEERDLTNRYMEDLFEEVPYTDPMNNDQKDDINPDHDDYTETPQQQQRAAPEYRSPPPEETLYPQERRHDPRDDETPVAATEATAPNRRRQEHNHEGQDDIPYMDISNDDDEVPEDVPGDAADQVPVEEVGEQITPRPREFEQEEVPTMLDEVAFHGADLAGGEGEIPLAILRVTDPVIRREVRNTHYNLGHPSTATLLRIMRRSGASDTAQRYARCWKCPLCAQRQAPRALNPTTAPYRPNTFNSMFGCDVKAIYDANGLKFEALNVVDLPSSTECAEKLWLWLVLWAGPPKTIVSDLGTSFRTAFQMMVERYGASSRTAPIESPWQIGMV